MIDINKLLLINFINKNNDGNNYNIINIFICLIWANLFEDDGVDNDNSVNVSVNSDEITKLTSNYGAY